MDYFKPTSLPPELLGEIKRLHFFTRKLADEGISGRYKSAFKGRGMEFEEVREYFPGDDVRTIDWKVTARRRIPYIKTFREERELTVMIAVDVSASTFFSTRSQFRDRIIAQVGAVLTLIALQNNDHVGLVTYSDRLETYHPPRKARGSVWRILHEVLSPARVGKDTDLAGLLTFLQKVLKRPAIVFLISDFIATPFEKPLAALATRHDITAISVSDPGDKELPRSGLVSVRDPETDEEIIIDTDYKFARDAYYESMRLKNQNLLNILHRHGIGYINLQTDQPFMPELRKYFDRRSGGSFFPR